VPADGSRIVGALYGTGIPDAAAILAHYNACKAANTMESMTGAGVVNVNRWQAKDYDGGASFVDDLGGMTLTKTGTLTVPRFVHGGSDAMKTQLATSLEITATKRAAFCVAAVEAGDYTDPDLAARTSGVAPRR